MYRLNLKYSSTLKSREYLARGIPFVYSLPIPGIDDECDYCFKVPSDDSAINIDSVMKWVNSLSKDISTRMRQYAKDNYSWEGQFQILLDRIGIEI